MEQGTTTISLGFTEIKPVGEVRLVKRQGVLVLQQAFIERSDYRAALVWRDVPIVDEH